MTLRLHELLGLDPQRFPGAVRYTLTGLLGEGGMGSVLLARDDTLQREVAIKIVNGELEDDAGVRFHREAKAMSLLNHPNIPRIYDYSGADCPRPYLVTERLVGHTLSEYIEQDPIPEVPLAAIGAALSSALDAAHTIGVIHRDLKPENVFIETSGRVVLIDFGLVKGFRDGTGTFAASATAMVGTPLFLSPEQCEASVAITPAADLFSLGSVLYYAATQVLAFRGDSVFAIMKALRAATPVPLPELVKCSAGFARLLQSLLAKDPKRRPASAEAAAQAFDELVGTARNSVKQLVATRALRRSEAKPLPSEDNLRSALLVDTFDEQTVLAQVRAAEDKLERTRVKTAGVTPMTTSVTRVMPAREERPEEKTAAHGLRTQAPPRPLGLVIGAAVMVLLGALAAAWIIARPKKTPEPVAAVVTPQTPALPAPDQNATVRFAVKPWGEVYVDGEHKGTAPSYRAVVLPLGAHEIEVRNPSGANRKKSVVLKSAGEEVTLKFDFTAPPDQP